MLRIRVEEKNHSVTLWLDGSLAGPHVAELENCWAIVLAGLDDRGLVVNLDALSFVDSRGKALLAEIYSAGARLKGKGAQSRFLVNEIQQRWTA
jgi:anti-anti-sigma regulatory factor